MAAKAMERKFAMHDFTKPVATVEEALLIFKKVRTALKLVRISFL